MFKLKKILVLFFLLVSYSINAQENKRVFLLKIGDEFEREQLISSNSSLQRGDQVLDVSSISSLTKSYVVKSTSPTMNSFNIKIKKMDNLINALDKQLYFNSNQKLDSTSSIQKALAYMVNKPVEVNVNNYGEVLSSNAYKSEFATDTLVAFAGIAPEIYEKGVLLNLFADLSNSKNLRKDFTWTDSVTINNNKLKTKFWIEDVNENITIVKFNSTIISQMVNSNSNGTYVIENKSGLITEKLIYTLSNGYQTSAGGVLYAVSRSTSISEKTKKISK